MKSVQIITCILIVLVNLIISDNCPDSCICLPDIIQCENAHLSELPLVNPRSLVTVSLANCSLAFRELNQRHFDVYKETLIKEFSLLSSEKVESIASHSFIGIKSHLINLEISTFNVEDYAFDQLAVKRLTLDGLRSLPRRSFSGIESVENLELINGKLDALPIEELVGLSRTGKLNSLSISGNNFQRIDESYDRLFRNLKVLDLSNNPWHCDCSISWLVRRYKSQQTSFSLKRPMCSSPAHLKGRLFDDLLTDIFEPHQSQTNSSILLCSRPRINQIDINLENMSPDNESAEISCKISSTKPVNIDWLHEEKRILSDSNFDIQETFKKEELPWEDTPIGRIRVSQKTNHVSRLRVKRVNEKDTFICNVHDDQTKETLKTSISIKWPIQIVNEVKVNPLSLTSDIPSDGKTKELTFLETGIFQKQFSLIELLGGILGTFLCTTFLFIIGYRISQNYSSSTLCCYYQNNSLPRKYHNRMISGVVTQSSNNNMLTNLNNSGNNFDEYLKQLTNFQTYLNQQNQTSNTSPIGTDSTNMSNATQKDFTITTTSSHPQVTAANACNQQQQHLLQNNFAATLMKNGNAFQDNGNFMFLPGGLVFPTNNTNQIQNKGYEIYTDNSQNLYDIPNKLTQEQTALLYPNQVTSNPLPITAPPPLFMNPNNSMIHDGPSQHISSPKFPHNTNGCHTMSNNNNNSNRFQPISEQTLNR